MAETLAGVPVERLAAARAAAAAAVRMGAGGVTVRMPRLGSVRHGTVPAALRGCPCLPCDRTRDQLAEVQIDSTPAVSALEPKPAAEKPRVKTTPPLVLREWPVRVVRSVPAGVDAAAADAASATVLRHVPAGEDAAELLLMLGLAAAVEPAAIVSGVAS